MIDLKLYRGDTREWLLSVTNQATAALEDLSAPGVDIQFQVKAADGDPDPPLIAKSIALGGIVVTADPHYALLSILPADTSGAGTPPGRYRYDIVTIINGNRQVLRPPSNIILLDVVNQA